MAATKAAAVVLAAGKGTRMKSALPKVMHAIAGRPMIGHVLASLEPLGTSPVVVVVAPGMKNVTEAVAPHATAIQESQLGTGHAVLAAKAALGEGIGDLLILYGDTPLITSATLQQLLERRRAADNPAVVVLGMRPEDGAEYGRLVTDDQGRLEAIVVRSRNGEALKIAEKLQGGGHANACGAVLPKSVRTIPDGIEYLRHALNSKGEAPLNSLDSIFASLEREKA